MLSLAPLQQTLTRLYQLDVRAGVDGFVRPMPHDHPERDRREVVLVGSSRRRPSDVRVAVLLDERVTRVLAGEADPQLSRFHAWSLALEAVSHFVLLAHRAANDRRLSQLELELQADVDKYVVGLVDRAVHRGVAEAQRMSRHLRMALFDRVTFHDPPDTERGVRYRRAHRIAARYVRSLERRFVRDGRWSALLDDARAFYRADVGTKQAMANAA